MAAWPMCARCRSEYENPLDRRYHAQPIACAECGPGYHLDCMATSVIDREPSRRSAGRPNCCGDGQIVAIKGIGGYHLACDAANRVGGRAHCGRENFARKSRLP